MRIERYLNTTQEQIEAKAFNIFIGISLGNKYFTKSTIESYILWAIKNTKQNVLILIADENHAINYGVFKKIPRQQALEKAMSKGKEMENAVLKIKNRLPKDQQHIVKVARWLDVKKSAYYQDKIKIVSDYFLKDKTFHDFVITIVRENLGKKTEGLSNNELDQLAMYIIDEIPVILNGVEFDGSIYDLHPYPGLSSLDDLFMGLQSGELFSELSKRLEISNQIAEVEGYA